MPSSLLVIASFAWATCASRMSCRGINCDDKPENCSYGSVEIRKKLVCAKGPGEMCGGYLDLKGKCGPGMYCDNCGLCRGCSTRLLIDYHKLECNNTTCLKQPNSGFL
nr:neuroparsin-A-like [Halyomorpha halys]